MEAIEYVNKPPRKLARRMSRVPQWVMPFVKGAILVVDIILATLSFLIAFYIRSGDPILSETAWAWSKEFVPYAGILYFAVIIRPILIVVLRNYDFRGAFSYPVEFSKIFRAASVGSLLIIAFAFLFRGGVEFRDFSYSRLLFAIDFGLALAFLSVFHIGLRLIQTRIRNFGINLIPTLVVGENGEAWQTVDELRKRKYLGYHVVGMLATGDSDEKHPRGVLGFTKNGPIANREKYENLELLSGIDTLAKAIREMAIQEVIITDNKIPSEKLFETMMECGRDRKVEFRIAPSLFNSLPQKTSIGQVGVLPLIRLFCEPLSDSQRFVKRFFDILIAGGALIAVAPFLLAIYLLIKIDSRGNVLFKQERVGMDGRKFLCYKFRTMFSGADENIHRISYLSNIDGVDEANSGELDKPVFGKVRNDKRITRIGRWLRRSSFDEVPQLLNVLVGDMSIVGPRPPIPYEVEEYEVWHRKRLDMKPGITGLWQVSGRNRLNFEEMVRIDLFYIENWSLWIDFKIMLMTIPAVLSGDGTN